MPTGAEHTFAGALAPATSGRHERTAATARLLSFVEDYAEDHPELEVKFEFGRVADLAPCGTGPGWHASITICDAEACIACECAYRSSPLDAAGEAIECTVRKLAELAGEAQARRDMARIDGALEELDRV